MFVLEPLLLLLAFALVFYYSGGFFYRLLCNEPASEQTLLKYSTLGMGWAIGAGFGLALFDVFYVTTVLLLLLLPAALQFFRVFQWRLHKTAYDKTLAPLIRFTHQPSRRVVLLHWLKGVNNHFGLMAVILLFFLPKAMLVYFPDAGSDSLSYHLPYAKQIAENHGLLVNPYLRYPLNALNFDLLFSVGFLFNGEVLARMFHVYAAFLITVGVYFFALQLSMGKWVAVIAAGAFIFNNLVTQMMVEAYIDVGLCLFVLATLVFVFDYRKRQQKKSLYLAAVVLGLAMGTKYLGLWYFGLFVLYLPVLRVPPKTAMIAVICCLLAASPWYLRNVVVSGNPIHPFAQSWFGYWLWTAADMVGQQRDLLVNHGVERSFSNLLQMPYLFITGAFNKHGMPNILAMIGIVLSLPALLDKRIRWLAVFSIINLLFWFFTSQIPRYLMSLMPILGLIGTFFFVLFISYPFTKLRKHLPTLRQGRVTMQLLWLLLIIATPSNLVRKGFFELPVDENEWFALQWQKPSYQLAMAANENHANGILNFAIVDLPYHADTVVMGDYFGKVNTVQFVQQNQTDKQLAEGMQAIAADHLAISSKYYFHSQLKQKLNHSPLFKILLENDAGILYQQREPIPKSENIRQKP